MKLLVLLALCFASPASAQLFNASAPVDVDAKIAAAQPPACPTPAVDTLNGTAGVAGMCMKRQDEARPTPVQAMLTTLAADCTWSINYSRTATTADPIVHASLKLAPGATQPVPCSPTAISATAASGKCFPAQTTTLNLSIITAGISLNPTAATCTAGMSVMVVVRDKTQ